MANQKYETQVRPRLEEVAMLARQGLAEGAIARRLGIAPTTLGRYKKEHRRLAEALSARDKANVEVLNAFFKRACGYTAQEEVRELKEIKEEDGTVRKELVVTKVVRKDVPPDLAAVKWWMENRGLPAPAQEEGQPGKPDMAQARALLAEKERILERLARQEEAEEEDADAEPETAEPFGGD